MEITKEFTFDASHVLPQVPKGHKCGRLHGHTYTVRLTVAGEVDPFFGWVQDYGEIKEAWKVLEDEHLDHRHLNDWVENPTAELLAWAIGDALIGELPLLARVEVRETQGTSALWDRSEVTL